MRLTKSIKEKIDNYFDNISPEELYRLSVKYGIVEASEELRKPDDFKS